VSNYWYDASGERTVKESGDNEGVNVNGLLSAGRTGTTNFTAYISPYLVVGNGGNYTLWRVRGEWGFRLLNV